MRHGTHNKRKIIGFAGVGQDLRNIYGTDQVALKEEIRRAKKIARDLFYPDVVLQLIENSQNASEISRVLRDARNGKYDKYTYRENNVCYN